MSPVSVRVLAGLLEERTGQQLVAARRWRIETVLKPLMRDRGIATLDSLAGMIAGGRDAPLTDDVIEALLNHETSFYRDIAAYQLLAEQVIGQLADARAPTRRLRIWCAGCSTGQEAYSIAMTVAEQGARWEGWTIEIIASDVSAAVVTRGRAGLYTQFEIQRGLPVRLMMSWFDPEGDQWRARPALRQRIAFHRHNLLEASPFGGRFDLILCRNVLLYFATETRRAVFDRLADAVARDGALMLGAGETVIGQTDRFESDVQCRGVYRPTRAAP